MKFADIIIPVPLDDSYTYLVPEEMEKDIVVGCRVQVGFGRSKTYVGIVVRLHDDKPDGFDLKPILNLIDSVPVVNSRQLEFWRWIAQYYICPLGDVYNAALPAKMKKTVNESKRKRKSAATDNSDTQLAIQSSTVISDLTPAQQTAYDEICASFESKDITLLHGVTSSGKTEIYIHIINKYISEGKQVLYLLPEIALTTQITERLQRVFGDDMGVYHSMFTDAQRSKVYQRQLSDNPYKLILGVRSSVFMPFQNLGLVIVDEEHETSYKQQDPAPRYHARSAAVMLARMFGAKTLLGTATPSIETYNLATSGRYGYVNMTQRYGDVSLPSIEVVDIARLRFQHRMKGAFSPLLLEAIGDALNAGGQVILFHNRRGYSNLLECKTCGWIPRCSHCDVSLTYHVSRSKAKSGDGEKKEPASRGFLVCHYCGKVYNVPDKCPNCESTVFSRKGNGTERIEDQISNYFPTARVLRMDTDTAHTRTAYEQIISDFSAHKYDILVGTQMVSKGLDFGGVTVVGILDADVMLNQPDFRSYERSFHMLT
ncbi:MAG: primosomal protein N', partial [Bacteroidaceae bacterium]|nr:primosomal protein N' [Bacteroidaceae bacterium]